VAASIAAALGTASAAVSAYWALGGTELLDTVGGDVEHWGTVLTIAGLLVEPAWSNRTRTRTRLAWRPYLWAPWFALWGAAFVVACLPPTVDHPSTDRQRRDTRKWSSPVLRTPTVLNRR
jgi:hypothetical protein